MRAIAEREDAELVMANIAALSEDEGFLKRVSTGVAWLAGEMVAPFGDLDEVGNDYIWGDGYTILEDEPDDEVAYRRACDAEWYEYSKTYHYYINEHGEKVEENEVQYLIRMDAEAAKAVSGDGHIAEDDEGQADVLP
jgi:hypothetical protein